MRALAKAPCRLGLVLAGALALAGCFDLQKIDPGQRIVDDFAGPSPTWARFQAWVCDSTTGDEPGTPAGDGGMAMAGPVTCAPESPGDGDAYALRAEFQLTDPADGIRQHPAAEIVSQTVPGSTVDLNAFTRLDFFAILSGTPTVPAGTRVFVELGCSSFPLDPIAWDMVTADLTGGDWMPVQLPLAEFQLEMSTHNQSCLAQVDSIRFLVFPGLGDGESAAGTLQLDTIKLLN